MNSQDPGSTASSVPPVPPVPKSRGGRSLALVFAGIVCIAVLSGLQGFRMYQKSETHLKGVLVEAGRMGLDAGYEGCVDFVMGWYARCEAMKSLCDSSVARVMGACLEARDRGPECLALGDKTRDTHFGFPECQARGVDRHNRKACATSYRAIDAHCTYLRGRGAPNSSQPSQP